MVYLAAGSWMLVMAILGDRPRLRDNVVTLGLGLGALRASLLFAVPAAGTALAYHLPGGVELVLGPHGFVLRLPGRAQAPQRGKTWGIAPPRV